LDGKSTPYQPLHSLVSENARERKESEREGGGKRGIKRKRRQRGVSERKTNIKR